jgi:hypothetical protein
MPACSDKTKKTYRTTLKTEAASSSEKSVTAQLTRLYIPPDGSLRQQSNGNLKSQEKHVVTHVSTYSFHFSIRVSDLLGIFKVV